MGKLARQTPIGSHLVDFVARLINATHPELRDAPEVAKRSIRYGVSPRGAQSIVLGAKITALLDGRLNVSVRRHRSGRLPVAAAPAHVDVRCRSDGQEALDDVIRELLEVVPQFA
ncbi:MAG: hypothetical protein R2845_06625 [Thermomicrobiales bacterium]